MKHKVLSSPLLWYVFAIIALENSSAIPIMADQRGIIGVTENKAMFAQKEPADSTGTAHMRKLIGLRSEKLVAHEEAGKSKNEKGAHGEGTSKISGKEEDASKKSVGKKKHIIMIAPKALKFTSFVIPKSSLSSTNSKRSQDSNPMAEESQGTSQKEENQNLEAEKEILNLFNRDYNAPRGPRPTRPPGWASSDNQEHRN
ncbi:hypothetical protein VNO77_35163 [Canavalia gladiata]|uniref:Uncharacterized protein n=1 Tax=Canavalia gladiata TaxID=3824 RepID=A0AAN9Q065_CANGL